MQSIHYQGPHDALLHNHVRSFHCRNISYRCIEDCEQESTSRSLSRYQFAIKMMERLEFIPMLEKERGKLNQDTNHVLDAFPNQKDKKVKPDNEIMGPCIECGFYGHRGILGVKKECQKFGGGGWGGGWHRGWDFLVHI